LQYPIFDKRAKKEKSSSHFLPTLEEIFFSSLMENDEDPKSIQDLEERIPSF